jgi:hypothetical protein
LNNQRVIFLTYIALTLFNVVFFVGKFMPSHFLSRGYAFFIEYTITFTMLDLFGTGAVVIDLISNYDEKPKAIRRVALVLTALFTMGFLAKIFMNFIDSTFVPPA